MAKESKNTEKPDSDERSGFSPLELVETLTGWSYEAVKSLFITIILVVILRTWMIEVYRIPSSSMAPTLFAGDHILVSKLSFGLEMPFSNWIFDESKKLIDGDLPKRGDVVAFHLERDFNRFFIKRVVGLPGDTLSMQEGRLIINGEVVERNKIDSKENLRLYQEMAFLVEGQDISQVQIFKEKLPGMEESHLAFYDLRFARFGEMMEKTVPEGHLFMMGDNRNELADSRFFGAVPIDRVSGKAKWVWLNYSAGDQGLRFLFRRIGIGIH